MIRRALRKEEDPLVHRLIKILRKVNRVVVALNENLVDKTNAEVKYLKDVSAELIEAYEFDWGQYGEVISDLADGSNELRDLDQQADDWIEFLDDQYNIAMELDLRATELDYPDDHPVFQFVDKIEEVLNVRMD